MKFCLDQERFFASWSWFYPVASSGILALVLAVLPGCDMNDARKSSPVPSEPSHANASSNAAAIFDLAGRPVDPFRADDAVARVFIFISTDCPISNRYAPEIRRLHQQFAPRKIAFWLVHADPAVSTDAMRKHASEFQLACDVLHDPKHSLVRRCRVRVTPEAAVFTRDNQLVYHGRIDDLYVELGQARLEARTHDLEAALEATLAGKPVPTNETRAIGCSIPSLK